MGRADADGWGRQIDDAPEKVEEIFARGSPEQRVGMVEKGGIDLRPIGRRQVLLRERNHFGFLAAHVVAREGHIRFDGGGENRDVSTAPVHRGKPLCVLQVSTDLMNWTSLYTNVTSTNGVFDFTNVIGSPRQFFRAVATP